MKVLLYHGPGRNGNISCLPEQNIVITTYGTLEAEWEDKRDLKERNPLFSRNWFRVVLDEGWSEPSAFLDSMVSFC